MRFLVATLCCLLATSVANAQRPEQLGLSPVNTFTIEVKPLDLGEPIPEIIRRAPMEVYTEWAKLHNELAYKRAQERADEFNQRHGRAPVTVTTVESGVNGNTRGSRGGWYGPSLPSQFRANRTERTVTRTYGHDAWGGGPVLLLNPYYRE